MNDKKQNGKKSTLVYFSELQNGHSLALWHVSRNLLILEYNEKRETVETINLKSANLDEHELIETFNKISGRECLSLLKSTVDRNSEREVSLYRDERGTLHLIHAILNFSGQTELTHYTNSNETDKAEIYATFEALSVEYDQIEIFDEPEQEIDLPDYGTQFDLFSQGG